MSERELLGGALVIATLIARMLWARFQALLSRAEQERKTAEANAQAVVERAIAESRTAILEAESRTNQVAQNSELMKAMVTAISDGNQRAHNDGREIRAVMVEQLDSMREVAETLKMQVAKMAAIDITTNSLKTDLHERWDAVESAVKGLPTTIGTQFTPVATLIQAFITKMDGVIELISDQDRRTGLFYERFDRRLREVETAVGVKSSEGAAVKESKNSHTEES